MDPNSNRGPCRVATAHPDCRLPWCTCRPPSSSGDIGWAGHTAPPTDAAPTLPTDPNLSCLRVPLDTMGATAPPRQRPPRPAGPIGDHRYAVDVLDAGSQRLEVPQRSWLRELE